MRKGQRSVLRERAEVTILQEAVSRSWGREFSTPSCLSGDPGAEEPTEATGPSGAWHLLVPSFLSSS